MKKFIQEFKEFALKGNVIDMAVAVVIGGAFGKIVSSLVDDIIMPLISLLVGGASVADWKWVITPASVAADGTEIAESALRYGLFIQNIIDFLIVALVIFIVLKAFMKLKEMTAKKEEVVEEEAPAETAEDVIKDMRRLMKKMAGEPEEE